MMRCVFMKISFTKLLLLLVAVWPLTGFAKNEGKVVADSAGRNYSHWYFGAEAGLPFLFGDFTSFSHHKTYIGYQFGGLAGYQLSPWIGFELSVRAGKNKMGAKSYAQDYYLGQDGMTYYTGQNFPTWRYRDVYSKVSFTAAGAQVNLTLNNFFSENRGNRRWTVLLSPAVYLQHFSSKLYALEDGEQLEGAAPKKWSVGVGGDLSLRYRTSRLFDVQLRTGISWVNNHRMDGVTTLIKSKDHFMASAGLAFIWKAGRKGTRDNVLYASNRRCRTFCPVSDRTVELAGGALPVAGAEAEEVKTELQEKELQGRIDSLCGRIDVLCKQLEQSGREQLWEEQAPEANGQRRGEAIGFNELPPVYFHRGRVALDTVLYRNELKRIVRTLKAHPELRFRVVGTADVTGGPEINRRISFQRAEALATWLRMQGIGEQRMEISGDCVDELTSAPNNSSILARRAIIEILN